MKSVRVCEYKEQGPLINKTGNFFPPTFYIITLMSTKSFGFSLLCFRALK